MGWLVSSGISFQQQLQALYLEHYSWLCSLLRRRLGSHGDAMDLAQDVYLLLLERGQIPPAGESRRYLTQIARGKVIDLFRHRQTAANHAATQACLPPPQVPSEENRALYREALSAIDTALAHSPPRVRHALLQSRLAGLPHRDIAAELQVSVSSVEKYIAQGLQNCRRYQSELVC